MKKTILLGMMIYSFSLIKAQEVKSQTNTPASSSQTSQLKKGKPHHTPDEKANKFVANMTEAIGLEENQKARVKNLALAHFKNMEVIKEKANGDKEKIKVEGKTSRKTFNDGLKNVLSASQFEAWKVKRKEAANQQKNAPENENGEIIED
jgi:hypothetical protein